MNDPIAKKLDEEWTPHVVNEPSIAKVRAWLKDKPEADIRLYLKTFEQTLEKEHPARAALLREELDRRAEPPPDRVKEILAWLRSKWPVAAVIVLVGLVGGAGAFQERLCKLVPGTPLLCAKKVITLKTWFPGESK